MSNENVFSQVEQSMKAEAPTEQRSLEVPVESITLPSKGLIYPIDSPLANEEMIEIKCMTAKEEDLLTSRALIKNGTVISQLLKSCIMNKAINPDDMLVGDRNAVLIAIRVTGYGPEYDVKIECPSCGEEFDNTFNLGALEIKSLEANPLAPNTNMFEYILPISGYTVRFKLLTGRDELEIARMTDKKKKLQTQIDTTITSRLYNSIISINSEGDRNKIAKMVSNLRAGDSRAFRKYMDSIEPGVNMSQKATCPHCNEESEVSIPLGVSFFWPDFGK